MNRMNAASRLLALMMTVLLVISMAACGANNEKKGDMSGKNMKTEMTVEEAVARFSELNPGGCAPVGECRALGEGFPGDGQEQCHDHDRRREKLW